MSAQDTNVDQNKEIYAINVFRLNYSDETLLFSKYELIFDPLVEDSNERARLAVRASRILKRQGIRCFSFSENIFCLNRKEELREIKLDKDRSNPNAKPINVRFNLVNERMMKDVVDESFLYNYIRYLIKEPLKNQGLVAEKQGYINKNNICPGQISQNYQYYIREGFRFNLLTYNNQKYIVFDLITQSEQERTLLEEFNRHSAIVYKKPLRHLTPEELKEMQDYYQGFRVRAKNNGYEYIIEEFALDKTPKDGFTTDEGFTTFIEYFKSKYNLSVFDEDQFLISVSKFNNPVYHLPELVNIVDPSFDLDINSKYQDEIEKLKNRDPKERTEAILKYIDIFNEILKPHNIEIEKEGVHVIPTMEGDNKIQVETSTGMQDFEYDPIKIASIIEKCKIETHNPLKNVYVLLTHQTEEIWDDFYFALTRMADKVGLKLPKAVNKIKIKETDGVPYSIRYMEAIRSLPTNGDFYFTTSYFYEENYIKLAKEKILLELAKPHIHLVCRNVKNEVYNRKRRFDRNLKYRKIEPVDELLNCYTGVVAKAIIDIASRINSTLWTLDKQLSDTIFIGIDSYQAKIPNNPFSLFNLVAFDGQGRYLTGAYKTVPDVQSDSVPDLSDLLKQIKTKIEDPEYTLVEGGIKRFIIIRPDYGNFNEDQLKLEEIDAVNQFNKDTSIETAYILLNRRPTYRIFKKKGDSWENPRITPIFCKELFEESEFIISANEPQFGSVNPVSYKVIDNKTTLSVTDLANSLAKLGVSYPNFLPVQYPAPNQFAYIFAHLFARILEKEPFDDAIDYPDYL